MFVKSVFQCKTGALFLFAIIKNYYLHLHRHSCATRHRVVSYNQQSYRVATINQFFT